MNIIYISIIYYKNSIYITSEYTFRIRKLVLVKLKAKLKVFKAKISTKIDLELKVNLINDSDTNMLFTKFNRIKRLTPH